MPTRHRYCCPALSMISRGRSRRHGASSLSAISIENTLRLGMLVVLLSSMIYLFFTHSLLSEKPSRKLDPANSVKTRKHVYNKDHFEQKREPSDPHGYVGETQYQQDPRIRDTQSGDESSSFPAPGGATHPMDYTPLRCEGGQADVDLSYWKDIPTDK